jgi:hypothetical protein
MNLNASFSMAVFFGLVIEFLRVENQVVEVKYSHRCYLLFTPKLRSLPTGEGQGGAKKRKFLI